MDTQHPGYIHPADKEPKAAAYKRRQLHWKPIRGSADVELIVELNAYADHNWTLLLQNQAAHLGDVSAWDDQISVRINEEAIERTADALDRAIENANTDYRAQVLPELVKQYADRQAEKDAERSREQAINERIAKLNSGN